MKIGNAQQARINNNYKNTKLKLLKANAVIWFNKIYRTKQLKPNHIDIRINGQNPQDKRTTLSAVRFRIKNMCIC